MEESPNVYLAYFSFNKRNVFETTIQIVERPPAYAFENFLFPITNNYFFPLNYRFPLSI